MKTLFTILAAMVMTFTHAQEYYYNGREKVMVYPSSDAFILFGIEDGVKGLKSHFGKTEYFAYKGFSLLEEKEMGFSMESAFGENLKNMSPAYSLEKGGNFKMFPTKTVRVKLKTGRSQQGLDSILTMYDVANIDKKYGIIRVQIKDIRQVLKLANSIFESGIAEFSLPDFYIEKKLNQVNDPLFPLQFQMNNTGQVIDGITGLNNIDCNALEAWNLSLGNNITIAVVDQGLEAHEDFGNRLIGGNTPITNGNGVPLTGNATHGMNSAGVASSSDNNLGLRGVAPNSNLLSVNIFAGGETTGDVADGLIWAADNGADVISNSWTFSLAGCSFTNADIENAIQHAISNGRGGNGSVVVFAAGNGGGCVEYPATNPHVIAVGAVDNQGNQFNYSARGAQLDLVAPSGETNFLGNVRTLDRMGNIGRLAGNYENAFGGTSAACPVVSGAAALVLSVNPNLTQQEVRSILNQTASDMGPNGFDNNFGYGRVNVLAAVEAAFPPISGPEFLCSSSLYNIIDLPDGTVTSWNVSPSSLFSGSTSGSGTTVNLSPASSQSSGQAILTFNVDLGGGNLQLQKTIWVGEPSISYIDFSNSVNDFQQWCSNDSGNVFEVDSMTHENTIWEARLLNWPSLTVAYTYPSYFVGHGPHNWTYAPSLPTQNNGYYVFQLRGTNDCGTTDWLSGFEVEYVDCSEFGFPFVIYPNPASDIMTVSKNSKISSKQVDITPFEISVFDSRGKQLVGPVSGKAEVGVDVSHLKNGFYFVHILYKGELIKKQVKVER